MSVAAFGVESEAELAVLKQSGFNLICHQVCIPWLSNPFLCASACFKFLQQKQQPMSSDKLLQVGRFA